MNQDAEHWKLTVHSTADVSLEILYQFGRELEPDADLAVERSQTFLRSTDPPSWIVLLTEAPWWVNGLAACAALYVAEIAKEAGKDTWKNRGRVARNTRHALGRLASFAKKIVALRQRLSDRTTVSIGLPLPDDYFATRLELVGANEDEIAAELALFVHFLPAVEELIRHEALSRQVVTGEIQLHLRSDLSLEVSWLDANSMTPATRRLALRPPSNPDSKG
jgi:hypothetical protein